MSKAIPMGPRPSLQPGTMRPQRLWRLGWIMAYIVLPFGKLSILGLLPLLGARLWQWRRGTDEAPPSNPLVIWANRLILSLLVLAALSAVFSSKPWLALTKVLAFGLMLYVYYFGAQSSAHAFGGCLLRTCYPLLMISGVITCIVSLVNCYYSGDMARAASFSSGPNSFATILIMLAGLGTGYLLWRGGRWRYLLLPYAGTIVYTLLMTKSRGGWLGFAAMAASFAAFNRRLIPAVLVLALVLTGVFTVAAPLRERLASAFALEQNSARLTIWQTTMRMIHDRPLRGTGFGIFSYYYQRYAPPGSEVFTHAHNLFLNIASEMGLPALAVFVAFILLAFLISFYLARMNSPYAQLYQSLFAVLLGVMVHQQVDTIIRDPDIASSFFMLIGLALGLYALEKAGCRGGSGVGDREL